MAGPPKPLDLGGRKAPEEQGARGRPSPPPALDLGGRKAPEEQSPPKRRIPPEPLSLPSRPAAAQPAPPAPAATKAPPPPLSSLRGPQRAVAPPSPPPAPRRPLAPGLDRVEAMVKAAVEADPQVAKLTHRLRPRFQQLEGAQERELLCWGEQNLVTSQEHSREQAAISQRLSQLCVKEWVAKCNEASTRPPGGLLAAFRPKERPDDYEKRFRQLQAELGPMIQKLAVIVEEVRPELEDLHLDAAALKAVSQRYTDPALLILIDNRWRILVQGQQVAAQTLALAEQTKALIVGHCQTLDRLISVTLPAWRLAQ